MVLASPGPVWVKTVARLKLSWTKGTETARRLAHAERRQGGGHVGGADEQAARHSDQIDPESRAGAREGTGPQYSTRLLSRDRSDDRPYIPRRSPFGRQFLIDDTLFGCPDVHRRFSMGAG
jgi:hypothetical protein